MSEQDEYQYLMDYDLRADEAEEWVRAMQSVILRSEPEWYWGQHRSDS